VFEAAGAMCADDNQICGQRCRVLQNLVRRLATVDEYLNVRTRRPETRKHLLAHVFHIASVNAGTGPKPRIPKSVSGTTSGLHT